MSDSKPSADELAAWQAEDADWLASLACDVTAPAPVAEHSDGFCMVCPPSVEARCECRRSSGLGSLGDAVGAPTPGVPIASTAAARAPLLIVIDNDSYKSKKKPSCGQKKIKTCSTPKCTTRARAPSDLNGKGAIVLCAKCYKSKHGKTYIAYPCKNHPARRVAAKGLCKECYDQEHEVSLPSRNLLCIACQVTVATYDTSGVHVHQRNSGLSSTHCGPCAEDLGFKAQSRSGASIACCRAIHELDREGAAKQEWLSSHGHYARVLAPGGPGTFDNNEVKYTVPLRDLKPDAVCFESRTVFLYHGNAWHGVPPDHKDFEEGKSTQLDKPLKELYRRTMADHEAYVGANWTVQYMWEHEHVRASSSGLMSISSCLRTHVSANASASSASSA